MRVIKFNGHLTSEEKETILNYNYLTKTWRMDSTVRKHFNKALKQGWIPLVQYVDDDEKVAGYVLEAPDRAITIRSIEKKQMSEKQLANLTDEDDDE